MRKLEPKVAVIAVDYDDFMDYVTQFGGLKYVEHGWYYSKGTGNQYKQISNLNDAEWVIAYSCESTDRAKDMPDFGKIREIIKTQLKLFYSVDDIEVFQRELTDLQILQKKFDKKVEFLKTRIEAYGLTADGWTVCSNDKIYVLHGYYESKKGKNVDDFQINVQIDNKTYRYLRKLALDGWDELDFFEREFFYQQIYLLCTIYPIDDDASLTDILLKTIWTLDGDTIVIDSSNVRNSMDNTEDICHLKISSMSIEAYNKLKLKID